jgi:hypothetical protein
MSNSVEIDLKSDIDESEKKILERDNLKSDMDESEEKIFERVKESFCEFFVTFTSHVNITIIGGKVEFKWSKGMPVILELSECFKLKENIPSIKYTFLGIFKHPMNEEKLFGTIAKHFSIIIDKIVIEAFRSHNGHLSIKPRAVTLEKSTTSVVSHMIRMMVIF